MRQKFTDAERKEERKARNARYQKRLRDRRMAARMYAAQEDQKT